MARIRSVKPEFWQDEKLAPESPLTRLVFLGLISQADDAGRLIDSVKMIDGLLFPYTDDTCGPALERLAERGRIQRYEDGSGRRLLQIVGWDRHQKVKNPSPYVLPGPEENGSRVSVESTHIDDAAIDAEMVAHEKAVESGELPCAPDPTEIRGRNGVGPTPRVRAGAAPTHGDRGSHSGDPTSGGSADPGPPPDDLADWLGQHAHVLDGCVLTRDPQVRRTLWQHFGPPGLRANAWKLPSGVDVEAQYRPRLLAIAISGYAAEGKRTVVTNEFAGLLRTTIAKELTLAGPPISAADEQAREEQRRERAQARAASDPRIAEFQSEAQASAAAEDEAAEWLEAQDDETKARATLMARSRLKAQFSYSGELASAPRTYRRRVMREIVEQLRGGTP